MMEDEDFGAAPQSPAANAEGPGFVGIKFCQECNNMLYPKEDKVL